ncbi:cysteine desulfurase family protein [Galbitalea soli]|uniref:Cysteine desulfurase n=1 Tax=Galbitalea soli TaxID=1268042 RepID=A0A7C9PNE6_9MICO|nr:cysteine desulfurase family protein [Galbitalea soli]NEM91592.1 cysteine desulfurase [Galbitalea soli]NYJ30286.1 cysteine desulfurase [Galbitalea soli]
MAIYLDHAATTPMTPRVREAYLEALGVVGNPSSIHSQGQNAKRMLEEARERVAASLGADAVEVTFTSGGTEAINLAVKGLYWERQRGERPRPRILMPAGEHHATVDAAAWLAQAQGAIVEEVPVDAVGRIDLDALRAALGDDVALVTAIWANNEVGTVQPVREIVALAAAEGVPVHLDAVAAYGYLPIDFHASGAAALSVSAHKIGGPVGIGALLIARSSSVTPLVHGGNQQRARSGTQDAAGAVAFGVAAAEATRELGIRSGLLAARRDRLIAGVRAAVPSAILRGDPVDRLPGNAHFTFPGCEGDSLLFLLDVAGFSVSTGSACQAGVPEASHVLLGMGVSEPDARGALRITIGHETTGGEVDAFVAALPAAVERATRAGLADRVVGFGA